MDALEAHRALGLPTEHTFHEGTETDPPVYEIAVAMVSGRTDANGGGWPPHCRNCGHHPTMCSPDFPAPCGAPTTEGGFCGCTAPDITEDPVL